MKVQLLTHAPSQHACQHCKNRRQPANSAIPAAERPQAASGSDEATRLIQDATAQAERIKNEARGEAQTITQNARAEALRIQDEARVAARGEAQTITQNARAEALRIQDEARAEAQTITQTARGNAQRIENEAQAQARRILQDAQAQAAPAGSVAPMATPLSGPFVAIFFQGELAAATNGFSAACRVGGGGFGSVYIAQLPRLGLPSSHFAVKKLDMTSMQGETEFMHEMQMLGGCKHENVVKLTGLCAEEIICLVTPLMKGGSLEDRLFLDVQAQQRLAMMPGVPENGFLPLTWQQRLRIALDAVRGLEYLHTADETTYKPVIFHRDIKPSNILLDRDGNARLADMGLARAPRLGAAQLTTVTSIAGTNGFLDEHYATTGQYDAPADCFAMGVTLLVLLTRWPAAHPSQGPIVGRCEVENDEDVMSLGDAEQWPRAVAIEMHKVAMGLVKRNRIRRITITAARQRLESLVEAHLQPAPADALERECILCMSAPRHVRFECGHSAMCRSCVVAFMQRARPVCPHCRRRVTQAGLIVSDDVAREDTFIQPLRR